MIKSSPSLVISLDFELFWGLRDCVPLNVYRENLLGVRQAIPAMLAIFAARKIRVTWATVGFLFCRDKAELEASIPWRLPAYLDGRLSPYDFSTVGNDERDDPFHFAPSLVRAIADTPGQEVASHTFSHFYCLEPGQTSSDFDADLQSARKAALRLDIDLKSLVFPRNQDNPLYHQVLTDNGIVALRPAARGWAYRSSTTVEPLAKRAARLVDAYVSLGRRSSFRSPRPGASGLVAVPASAFLRPYTPRFASLDPLLLRRVADAMTLAAREGEVFHLWWHPHNFGTNLRANLDRLTKLLDHFDVLKATYGMASLSMGDVAVRAAAERQASA
jgi:hypothetical protein